MVPVKLSLKNFLSYADENPPLDFTQFHVACLSGNNGHGKSALLDAITWALWGEARSRNEDLMRLGAQEMSVEFEFDLEGNRYRVLRRFRRTARSGTHRLDFQVFDPVQNKYLPLTQPALTQTEEKIKQTLRMDYATFINSAFILQGRADEFTRKNARERKEILSEILGLSRYDEMAQRARERARNLATEMESLGARLKGMDDELQHRDEYETNLAELRERAAQVEAEVQQREEELSRLRDERAALLAKRQQAEELAKRLKEAERDIRHLTANVQRQRQLVQQWREILTEKDTILADFQRYQDLQMQHEEFTQKLRQLQVLSEKQGRLELAIERERAKVEQERTRAQSLWEQTQKAMAEADAVLQRAAEIEAGCLLLHAARQEDENWERRRVQHEKLELLLRELERNIEKARSEIQAQVDALKQQGLELKRKADALPQRTKERSEAKTVVEALRELSVQREAAREKIQTCAEQLAQLKAQKDAAESESQMLEQRLAMIRSVGAGVPASPIVGAGVPASPRCPLCRQPLDEKHQQDLERQMAQEKEAVSLRLQAILRDARHLKQEKDRLDKQVKEWEERLRQLPAAQQKLADAITAERDAHQAAEKLKEIKAEVQALTQRLEKKDFALREHETLAQVMAELERIGYDPAQHHAVRQSLRDLMKFEAERQKQEEARERRNQAAESLPTLEASLKRLNEILEGKTYAADLQHELDETLLAISSLNYSESAHQAVQEALKQLSAAPARKERLDNAEKQIDAAEQNLQELEQSLADKEEQRRAWQTEIQAVSVSERDLQSVEQRINQVTASRAERVSERDRLIREQGEMEAKARALEKLAQEKVAEEERMKKLQHEHTLYDKLAVAFGRDGIPALIIENAIPEIEDEANRLLSRLTDNRVNVSIEPLRDLRSGSTKETLDIKVSDELGTRPLELFSGGESFRVDFALRIALSKLLARRAGTRLRTLVVDEGFGTQDTEGLQRILEAINVIREDFDKILVITHLETLKNAFPARIEVIKLPDVGSKYELIL